MKLGKVALDVFPKTSTLHTSAGDFFYMSGFSMALFLWGFGLVWLCLALASISRYRKIPFNVSWWAATFPWGVYATSTMQIGVELPSSFFRILGVVSALGKSFHPQSADFAKDLFWMRHSPLAYRHGLHSSKGNIWRHVPISMCQ